MANKTLITKLLLRNDTTLNWTDDKPLSKGEIGIAWSTDTNATAHELRIGGVDGTWGTAKKITSNPIFNIATATGTGNVITGLSAILEKNEFGNIVKCTIVPEKGITALTSADSTKVVINGTGNTIVSSTYDNVTHTLTLTKGDRVSTITGDIKILVDATNATAPTIKHADSIVTTETGAPTTEIKDLSYDASGHITKVTNRPIEFPITSVTDTPASGNVLTGLSVADHKLVTTRTSLYTKAEIDNKINDAINPAMTLKGTIGVGGTITVLPAATIAVYGDTYKVVTDGTYNSILAKVGDVFSCYKSGDNTYDWMFIPSGDDVEDTWRSIAVNDIELLSNSIGSGKINFKNGNKINITTATGGVISFEHISQAVNATVSTVNNATFSVIDTLTYDESGHISSINTKTVTVPVPITVLADGLLKWDTINNTYAAYTEIHNKGFYTLDSGATLNYGGNFSATKLFAGMKETLNNGDFVILDGGNATTIFT